MEFDLFQTGEGIRKHTRIICFRRVKLAYRYVIKKTPSFSVPNFSARHCDLYNKSVTVPAKKISYAIQALSERVIYTAGI